MKRFFLGLASMFTSCFFPSEQSIGCEGLQIIPYTGHPVDNIRRTTIQNPSLQAPSPRIRIKVVTLADSQQPQPNVNVPSVNVWELINRRGTDIPTEQMLGNIPEGRIFKGRDNTYSVLTQSSSRHLCGDHAYSVGIDDLLKPNLNAKPTKYPSQSLKTRTQGREGLLNQLAFGDIIQTIIQSPDTIIYPEIQIRGVSGHGYVTTTNFGPANPKYAAFFVGILTEGPHAGRLIKAQPLSGPQLKKLKELNKLFD